MTGNPHPDHGPLWVERDSDGRVTVWTEDIHGDPYAIMTRTGEQADAIEAQLTPLPDGVYRQGNAHLLQSTFAVPDGWVRENRPEDRGPSLTPSVVRRIPAEPPAPPTEDVPWWESVGRKLGKGPERGNVIRRCGKNGNHAWINTHRDRDATDVPDGVNPDGTVTVQRETETDGAS